MFPRVMMLGRLWPQVSIVILKGCFSTILQYTLWHFGRNTLEIMQLHPFPCSWISFGYTLLTLQVCKWALKSTQWVKEKNESWLSKCWELEVTGKYCMHWPFFILRRFVTLKSWHLRTSQFLETAKVLGSNGCITYVEPTAHTAPYLAHTALATFLMTGARHLAEGNRGRIYLGW